MMYAFFLLFGGLATTGLCLAVLSAAVERYSVFRVRMAAIRSMGAEEDATELASPFIERVIQPLYRSFLDLLSNFAPLAIYQRYEHLAEQAGLKQTFGASRVIGIQVLLGFFIHLILYNTLSLPWALMIAVSLASMAVPYLILFRRADQRRIQIEESLPDFIDLLHLCLEAGISLDLGLRRTADHSEGPLSEEFKHTQYEISRGRDRREALQSMVYRIRSSDLGSFIHAVLQAEELGVNMISTLRAQAQAMRQKKRQRMEAQTAKLATKMLFPIIFMIFPALMAIILGPSLLRIIDVIGKG